MCRHQEAYILTVTSPPGMMPSFTTRFPSRCSIMYEAGLAVKDRDCQMGCRPAF